MRVHWTDTARAHLRAIHDYIALNSPQYALRTVDRLTRRTQQIGTFPLADRVVPEYQSESVRELFEGPFGLIYRVGVEQVDVLAVIHGRRSLSGDE